MAEEHPNGLPELVRERAAGAPTPLHLLVLVFTVACFGALIGTTQWLAAHFGYDPRLGRPLYSVPYEQRSWLGLVAMVAVGLAVHLLRKKDGWRRAPVVAIAAALLGEYVPDASGETSRPNPLPHAHLAQLKNRGVRQTVYLVVPPPFLEAYGPWVRLMQVAISDIMTRTIGRPDLPLLVVLEELGNIGKVDAVRRGVTLVAGYGIRYWMIVQDLAQVEEIYGKAWRTMFANARVKQLFGTSDLQTAKELSELMGDTTVYSDSGNVGKSLDNAGVIGKGKSISDGASEKGRRLVTPDEVLAMPNEKQLLQVRGHRPVYADKLNYLEMPEVRGLYLPNPMYS